MIKVDKNEFSCDGAGLILLAELCIAVKAVAGTLGLTNEFVLEGIAYSLKKEADKDETNLC